MLGTLPDQVPVVRRNQRVHPIRKSRPQQQHLEGHRHVPRATQGRTKGPRHRFRGFSPQITQLLGVLENKAN